MTTPVAGPNLSLDKLTELLTLLKESDSAELKATINEEEQYSAIRALGLDPLEAQIRQVFFFDTPDLDLFDVGVVVRARRVQGVGDDTVVKLRPVDPSALSPELRKSASFGVEVDAMPGGSYVCSGSFKGTTKGVHAAVEAGGPYGKLFSKEQRQFFKDHAPSGLKMDDLSALGPIFVLKVKVTPEVLGRKLVAELWFYPDGTRVLELSTKCLPSETFQVAVEVSAYLESIGIDITGAQQTKTRTALDFFSTQLKERAAGR